MSAGTRVTNDPASLASAISAELSRSGEEARRSTEQLKLRLRPDEALRLRTAADTSGRTLSDFVIALLDGRGQVSRRRDDQSDSDAALAEVSRLANAMYALAENLRLSRGDLGRGLGLMKNLFNEAGVAAEAHRFALDDAIRDVRAAIVRADDVSAGVAGTLVPLRAEVAVTVRRLARL